jgi:hypothetical protein
VRWDSSGSDIVLLLGLGFGEGRIARGPGGFKHSVGLDDGECGFKVGQFCEELVAQIGDSCLVAIRAAMLQFHESNAE